MRRTLAAQRQTRWPSPPTMPPPQRRPRRAAQLGAHPAPRTVTAFGWTGGWVGSGARLGVERVLLESQFVLWAWRQWSAASAVGAVFSAATIGGPQALVPKQAPTAGSSPCLQDSESAFTALPRLIGLLAGGPPLVPCRLKEREVAPGLWLARYVELHQPFTAGGRPGPLVGLLPFVRGSIKACVQPRLAHTLQVLPALAC